MNPKISKIMDIIKHPFANGKRIKMKNLLETERLEREKEKKAFELEVERQRKENLREIERIKKKSRTHKSHEPQANEILNVLTRTTGSGKTEMSAEEKKKQREKNRMKLDRHIFISRAYIKNNAGPQYYETIFADCLTRKGVDGKEYVRKRYKDKPDCLSIFQYEIELLFTKFIEEKKSLGIKFSGAEREEFQESLKAKLKRNKFLSDWVSYLSRTQTSHEPSGE